MLNNEQLQQPILSLTKEVVEHFKKNLKEDDVIHLSYKASGCSGYKHSLSIISTKDIQKDDILIIDGLPFFIDQEQKEVLTGTTVSMKNNGKMGKSVVFTNNNIRALCGCGESFTI